MHENLLARALLPDPYVVLGRRLMPYSLGCELQLHREENPLLTLSHAEFAALPGHRQIYALIRAVTICCARRPLSESFWLWSVRGKPLPLTRKTSLHLGRPANFAFELADFRNYLLAHRLEFRAELPTDNDLPVRYLGSPELLRLFQFLNRHVARPELEIYGPTAWDFPLGLAKMLLQNHAEEKGVLEIFNLKTKIAEDYHAQCEAGAAAWAAAISHDDKLAAVRAHPIIRELPYLADELAALENPPAPKGDAPCPA